jgi:hypothetical protein
MKGESNVCFDYTTAMLAYEESTQIMSGNSSTAGGVRITVSRIVGSRVDGVAQMETECST